MMRIGDIVITPGTGFYGKKPAIVTSITRWVTTVHTGALELTYETAALHTHGTIKLGRKYGNSSGRRFRVCVYQAIGGTPREVHVCTRELGALGEETRALEVRKLAFKALRD
jgi:hypothetical protein